MKQVKQILVAIDRSAMAEEALKRAISVAKKKEAQLIILHVIEPHFIKSLFYSVDENEIKKKVTDQINRLNSEAKIEYVFFIEFGSAARVITLMAQKVHADLLIVGVHGKNDISSEYFGSTALKLIQRTHIPVLIVKNEVKAIYQKMIAPTDMADYSKKSILFAKALFTKPSNTYLYAAETISELQAITYNISEEERQRLQKEMRVDAINALEAFVKEVGGGETALIDFTASVNEDLLTYMTKDNADLLVLGSKGVDNLNSFVFGSTASYLMQRSPTDVLVYVPLSVSS